MARSNGWLLGVGAVVAFSLTIPMTRLAVPSLGPEAASIGRTAVAGLIAAAVLALRRERLPARHARSVLLAGFSAMLLYPLLAALALRHVPATHGAVVVGFLPSLTAIFAVLRGGERPGGGFWAACGLGALSVAGFAIAHGGGHVEGADGLLALAALVCAYGYAEGAQAAKALGGWRVVCWGQALLLPVTLPLGGLAASRLHGVAAVPASAWLAFADLVLVSALGGFFLWYAALARGGVARIGQLQLLQLPLSCLWSVAFLGERLDLATLLAGAATVLSAGLVFATRRSGGAPVAAPAARGAVEAAAAA